MNRLIVLLAFILSDIGAYSQSTLSLEFMPLGVHPFERKNYLIYENRVDENGAVVVEPGGILTYEFFVKETYNSFELQQGFFADAAAQNAGYTGFYFRKKFFHKWKHSVSISAGPALTYRNLWSKVDGYLPEGGYTADGDWEFRWAIIPRIQYNYYFGRRSDIALTINYNYERQTFAFSFGYRYWLQTQIKHPADCDCANKYRKKFKDYFR